ncbi:MAG: guanine deaminase, partial [Rhizobium sp.]
MTTLLRGRLLSFKRLPQSLDDTASYAYESDGGLLIENGMIVATGPYADIKAQAPEDATEIDHRPHLILPGFIDMHLHFPQMQVIA